MNTSYTTEQLWDKMDELKELLGTEVLLEELCRAMNSRELQENLEYIDRMNDTGLF